MENYNHENNNTYLRSQYRRPFFSQINIHLAIEFRLLCLLQNVSMKGNIYTIFFIYLFQNLIWIWDDSSQLF